MIQKQISSLGKTTLRLNTLGLIIVWALALFTITSCGGGAKDGKKELDVTNAQVEGDNNDVISIEDGKYTLVGSIKGEMGQELYIKLKIRLEEPIRTSADKINFENGSVSVEIIDKNDVALLNYPLPIQDGMSFKKFITEGKEGDVKEFKFLFLMNNKEQYAKIMDEAVSVRLVGMSIQGNDNLDAKDETKVVSSDEENDDNTEIGEEDNDNDLSETTSGDENFDEWLNEYEEYCNSYIALMKKASNGDMSVIAEYTKMLQKAQKMSKKMEDVKGDLTPAQLAKFQRIQAKLMKAAQNLQ